MSHFDSIRFDDKARKDHEDLKMAVIALDSLVRQLLKPSRPAAIALTHIQDAFLWLGVAIKEDQQFRERETKHDPKGK